MATQCRSIRCGLWLALLGATAASASAGEPIGPITFEAHVRPILKAQCFQCHGEEAKPKGGLDLRLVRTIIRGGLSGGAIEPGEHEQSLIWERVSADEMPP